MQQSHGHKDDRLSRQQSITKGSNRSLKLIESEAYRRIMSGEPSATLTEFSPQLLDWLGASYPDASPITRIAVENHIRDTWHRRHDMIRGGAL